MALAACYSRCSGFMNFSKVRYNMAYSMACQQPARLVLYFCPPMIADLPCRRSMTVLSLPPFSSPARRYAHGSSLPVTSNRGECGQPIFPLVVFAQYPEDTSIQRRVICMWSKYCRCAERPRGFSDVFWLGELFAKAAHSIVLLKRSVVFPCTRVCMNARRNTCVLRSIKCFAHSDSYVVVVVVFTLTPLGLG